MNRQMIGKIAAFHFAPTIKSQQNLLRENISSSAIWITGNTVIDALHMALDKIRCNIKLELEQKLILKRAGYDVDRTLDGRKIVLITGHRRENFGVGFVNICLAIKELSTRYPNVDFVYPMHLNPNVRNPINGIFGMDHASNLFFIEPLEYLSFIYLMDKSFIVLTDSGGIQEEAPSLGKPVLVMRETTERPEAVEAGTVKLVGTDYDLIVNNVSCLLDDTALYLEMSKSVNPYGDGNACDRIISAIK